MAEGKPGEILIAFKTGHYKKVVGTWKGDSVWAHFKKASGGMVHANKAEVEYIETFEEKAPAPAPETEAKSGALLGP